ncbi:MAG: PIN domain-containing protein [Coriobacteriales bacterium]|nr:PIN domain-containing protein [Coriobacteriales bacterium]
MLPIVDANVILRYLLNDVEEQSEYAKKVIEQGCEITAEVLAEVVYVLKGVYQVPKEEISALLTALLDIVYLDRHAEAVYALELFKTKSLDFVDCLLAAQHMVSDRKIITFDKKLNMIVG